jgi:predicted XRE-type DNA-binding protein
MDKKKRAALEAAGFRVGDAEDFLGLTEAERRLVELRVNLSRTVRRLREEQQLTQKQLAAKLKSSQSRVAKIELGAADVSLDLLFRGLFTLGGGLPDLNVRVKPVRTKRARAAAVQNA